MFDKYDINENGDITALHVRIDLKVFMSIAFARNIKMMRIIDNLYFSDEKKYLETLKHSKYKNSRLITDIKYELKENALRALSVIEVASTDDNVYIIMHNAVIKNFKKLYEKARNSESKREKFRVLMAHMKNDKDFSDIGMFSDMAIFTYFCLFLYGGFKSTLDNDKDYVILDSLMSYHKDSFKSYSEVIREEIKLSISAQTIVEKLLSNSIIQKMLKHKSISSLLCFSEELSQKLDNYAQVMWRLTQFDNVPITIYEEETFTRNDLLDIINVIALSIRDKKITEDDAPLILTIGLIIRSFSRMHKKLVDKLSNNTTVSRLSYNENEKKLKLEISSIKDKYDEQIRINRKKQQELNAIQIKYDKSQNTINTLNSKIEELEEKTRVLEALLERKDIAAAKENTEENKKDDNISILNNKNIVVFGGPPNWHTSVKKVLPNATCIPVSNKSFNTSIIDNSDIIVIKTDYLSHAQWYKIINQARNKNKKVLYCQNNIDMLLSDLINTVSVQDN